MKSLAAAFFFAVLAAAAQADDARSISVTGAGEVSARPDIAHVTAGVASFADTARAAMSENAAAMNAIFDVLRNAGVADKDIVTVDYSVSPRWRTKQRHDGAHERELAGYEAINVLRVTSRDLPGLGALIDAVAGAGGNDIRGIVFDIADRSAMQVEARRLAVRDATARARTYAEEAGVKLGEVSSIAEAGAARPMPQFRAMAEMSAATPIAAGELSVSASVSMTFAIE